MTDFQLGFLATHVWIIGLALFAAVKTLREIRDELRNLNSKK